MSGPQLARSHELLVTVEENVIMGGAGGAVAESLSEQNIEVKLLHLGLPDQFIDHGEQAVLLAAVGLDCQGIVAAVSARMHKAPRKMASIVDKQ